MALRGSPYPVGAATLKTLALAGLAAVGMFAAVRALLPPERPPERPPPPRSDATEIRPRRVVPRGRLAATPVQPQAAAPRVTSDLAGSLRAEDPHAASVLFEGLDRAVYRLLDQAWRRARGTRHPEPLACLDDAGAIAAVRVRVDVDAEPVELIVHDARVIDPTAGADAATCIERWLAGEATVLDEEVDGAFPSVRATYEIQVPLELGGVLAPPSRAN